MLRTGILYRRPTTECPGSWMSTLTKSVTAVTAPINNWKLIVSDNGTGRPEGRLGKSNPGLGPTIVEALAKQLDACVEVLMDTHGTTASITHAPIALPVAA